MSKETGVVIVTFLALLYDTAFFALRHSRRGHGVSSLQTYPRWESAAISTALRSRLFQFRLISEVIRGFDIPALRIHLS